MSTLFRQIEHLLLEHDCVIVPSFGAFIASEHQARVSEAGDSTMLPPYRIVRFNQEVTGNDGLLASSYMHVYDANYPDACRQMELDICEMQRQLDVDGQVVLQGIGTLSKDLEGIVSFQSLEAGVLTPSLFGLSSLELRSVDELEAEHRLNVSLQQSSHPTILKSDDKDKEKNDDKAVTIRIRRRWVEVAAAAVVAVFLFSLFYFSSVGTREGNSLPASFVSESSTYSEMATKSDNHYDNQNDNDENNDTDVSTTSFSDSPFVVVLACKVDETFAGQYVDKIKKAGFPDVRMETNNNQLMVVYAGYDSWTQAANSLNQRKKTSKLFSQAWVLEK